VYDSAWVETIASALPAEQRDHYHRGGLIPFFEHLGPEGWLRGRQARAGATAAQDDFGLLLNYGADCIGAVGILKPDGTHLVAPHEPNVLEEAAALPGRTLSGVQKKLLAFRGDKGFEPCVKAADPATHIAKFNREALKDWRFLSSVSTAPATRSSGLRTSPKSWANPAAGNSTANMTLPTKKPRPPSSGSRRAPGSTSHATSVSLFSIWCWATPTRI
jgi:HipA-like protein